MELAAVPRRRMRLRTKWITLAAALLFIALLAAIGISAYVGWALTHPVHTQLKNSPSSEGLVFDNITFPNEDGLKLHGWFIRADQNGYAPNGKTIIYVHSYQGNRLETGFGILSLQKQLTAKGYNALLFDMRGNGESEGKLSTIGYLEQKDVLSAIGRAKQLAPGDEIILYGFSMGASTALLAAGQSDDVRAVIADSPFSNLKPFLQDNLSNWSGLPDFPFTPLILRIMPALTDIDMSQVNPSKAIGQLESSQSVLLIHGMADNSIPYRNSEDLQKRSSSPDTQLWLVPGADHVNSRKAAPEQYDAKVITFLDGL